LLAAAITVADELIDCRADRREAASLPPRRIITVMDLQFTAVFRQVPEGYIGFVEELPGANTQGATLDEARANLQEAVAMILEANRELAQQSAGTGPVIREPLKVSA
jgi:predicted RNase H-like HicB family nuclease